MTAVKFDPGAPKARGYSQSEVFTLSTTPKPIGSAPVVTNTISRSCHMAISTSSGVRNDEILAPSQSLQNPVSTPPSFRALDPAIATVDSAGQITGVTNGTARIACKLGGIELAYSHQVVTSGTVQIVSVTGYETGSLGKHIQDAIATLISGKTAQGATLGLGGVQNRWTAATYGVGAPAYTSNAGFFAASYDFSSVSVATTRGGNWFGFPVVLVSARHVVAAYHVAPSVGDTVIFRTVAGAFETRTILSSKIKTDFTGVQDAWVGLLSSAITTITPAKVLPANWINWIAGTPITANRDLPMLCKTVHAPDAIVDDGTTSASGPSSDRVTIRSATCTSGNVGQTRPPLDAGVSAWGCRVSSGDSGGPCFMPINGALVLVGQYYGVDALGNCPTLYLTQLQAAMDTLKNAASDATAYPLTQADLSGFNAY